MTEAGWVQDDGLEMTWIKICGMTNLADALIAVDAGADAVGFVFYEKSPRCVSVETVREIVNGLPESVEKIGVFVSGSGPDQMEVMAQAALTGTQSYASGKTRADGNSFKAMKASSLPPQARFLAALPLHLLEGGEKELQGLVAVLSEWKKLLNEASPAAERLMGTFVLDSGGMEMPGGTGKTFDWERAAPLAEGIRKAGLKLVVAGGLTPHNVGEAIGILKPFGVDVVSGVEASPGKKDPEKVRAFVRAVREADRRIA
jgi:phosphoribosylanthranilate isomerase